MRCEISGRECPTLDEHHVIPREYGGINGPTVNIDPAIHQAVHRYANHQDKLNKFLAGYPAEVRARIQMLVTAVRHAEATLERVQSSVISITFSKEERKKLADIAKDMDMSESELVRKIVVRFLN